MTGGDRIFHLRQVADRLGRTTKAIRTDISRGSPHLPPLRKMGGRWVCSERDLEEWLAACPPAAKAEAPIAEELTAIADAIVAYRPVEAHRLRALAASITSSPSARTRRAANSHAIRRESVTPEESQHATD